MKKKEYTVHELIHNQSFRRMIEGVADMDEIHDWDSWLEESQHNRRIAKEAKSEILGFEFKDPSQADEDKEWKRLYSASIGRKHSTSKKISKKKEPLKWVYRIAAIIILAGVIGIGLYVFSEQSKESTKVDQITEKRMIGTQSNEQKTIKFSNGSRIILNSNSMLNYSVGTVGDNTIDVVLRGEAYFDAESDSKQKEPVFTVHTPDGIIRDIGTEFMVTVQKDHCRVVLQEGQVEVNTKQEINGSKNMTIQKGELVEFTRSKVLNKKAVNATFYTSWATGSMKFDHTTIEEFAGFVEQRFDGVQVQLVDPQLADIQIDGGIYFRSLEELVRSVSQVAKIPVYQSADRQTIYIGNQQNRESSSSSLLLMQENFNTKSIG